MRQRVDQHRSQRRRVSAAQRSHQERAVLKRLPLMVDHMQHLDGSRPQPVHQQRLRLGRAVRNLSEHPELVRHRVDQPAIRPRRRLLRQEQARHPESQRTSGELHRRHPGRLRDRQSFVIAHRRQRLPPAAEEHSVRCIARIVHRQPQPRHRILLPHLRASNRIEQLRAVAQKHRRTRDRIPQHIAVSAQRRRLPRDRIPVCRGSLLRWRSNPLQPLGRVLDRPSIERDQLQPASRRQRLRQRHHRLARHPRVIRVRIDPVLDKRQPHHARRGTQAKALPRQRRRELDRQPFQRHSPVVAHLQTRMHFDRATGRHQMHIQVISRKSQRLAFLIRHLHGSVGRLRLHLRRTPRRLTRRRRRGRRSRRARRRRSRPTLLRRIRLVRRHHRLLLVEDHRALRRRSLRRYGRRHRRGLRRRGL